VPYRFPVRFTRDAFSPGNPALAGLLGAAGSPPLVLPVADRGVTDADPGLGARLESYAARYPQALTLAAPLATYPGGESCKDGPAQVEALRLFIHERRLCRHSVLLAIGGGAFLDVAGYAAATAHRGIRLVRMPTTTLAQCDAGIGVKNGYNAHGRKNWVGAFAPPFAVLNDFRFLDTLTPRHHRSGLAEAVKVAVIKDAPFFRFLCAEGAQLASRGTTETRQMILRCARIHMEHTAGGDPFEQGSSRPLDFGHWAAHALEDASGGEITHGEAVAIGVALDSFYARDCGLLGAADETRIAQLLRTLGFSLSHPLLARIDLASALESFRLHLGGRLTVTLATSLGQSVEVNEMDLPRLHRSRERLMETYAGGAA
jgi:3-dehydroquinate synthase